jgi:hypothetical protein
VPRLASDALSDLAVVFYRSVAKVKAKNIYAGTNKPTQHILVVATRADRRNNFGPAVSLSGQWQCRPPWAYVRGARGFCFINGRAIYKTDVPIIASGIPVSYWDFRESLL